MNVRSSLPFCLLILSLIFVCTQLTEAQSVPWGYRPSKGQILHINKLQRMKVIGRESELTIAETFEILIREIDSSGAFLFNVRSVAIAKPLDSSGSASMGSVFHGQTILGDGTFAEISVTRNGEFVAGRFDRETEYFKKRRRAFERSGHGGLFDLNEYMLLKAICNDFFPPLCDSSQLRVGTVWTDSSNYRLVRSSSDTNKTELRQDNAAFPMRWSFSSIGYYGTEKCIVLNARHPNAAATQQTNELPAVTRQDIYLRLKDGLVLHHEAELIGGFDNGKSWRNSVMYQLLPE